MNTTPRWLFRIALATSLLAGCSGGNVDYTPPAGDTDMAIIHYSFGRMVIDGADHHADLTVAVDGSIGTWGLDFDTHVVTPGDLKHLLGEEFKTLIIGAGYNNRVQLGEDTKKLLETLRAKGKKVHVLRTSDAVKKFNALSKEGLIACFHLNC